MIQATSILDIRINGEPKGEPRHRTRCVKLRTGNCFPQEFPDHSADGWRQVVQAQLARRIPTLSLEGPISVELDFFMPRPQRLLTASSPRHAIPCLTRPDADNLAKLILDVMTRAEFWRDDAQVTDLHARKWYAAIGEEPGVRLVVCAAPQSVPLFAEVTPGVAGAGKNVLRITPEKAESA